MARKKGKSSPDQTVMDYRHEDAKRKNIPPAGLAAQGKIKEKPKIQYAYNPHLPPILRFDKTGKTDGLPELLETARTRPLTLEEAEILAEALRKQEPWLEWAGKQEKKGFEVDPVALHIHERIATQAILKVIAREDVQRSLFADPQLEYQKAVQLFEQAGDKHREQLLEALKLFYDQDQQTWPLIRIAEVARSLGNFELQARALEQQEQYDQAFSILVCHCLGGLCKVGIQECLWIFSSQVCQSQRWSSRNPGYAGDRQESRFMMSRMVRFRHPSATRFAEQKPNKPV